MFDPELECIVPQDIIEIAGNFNLHNSKIRQRSTQPAFLRDSKGNLSNERNRPHEGITSLKECTCSCFWDEKRKIRFIFY
jgi:hypothetical protein